MHPVAQAVRLCFPGFKLLFTLPTRAYPVAGKI
jgi:hypothetical protein